MRASTVQHATLEGSSTARPLWEIRLRQLLRLPRHYTANDNASILPKCAAVVLSASSVIWVLQPAVVGWPVLVAACTFAGLAIGQYSHYTARTGVDCWSDESLPVIGIMVLACLLVGFTSGLAVLLPRTMRAPALLCLCAGLLSVPRLAVPIVGSLYDGTCKARRRD